MRLSKYNQLNLYFARPCDFNDAVKDGRMLHWILKPGEDSIAEKAPQVFKLEIQSLDPERYTEVKVKHLEGSIRTCTKVSVRVNE